MSESSLSIAYTNMATATAHFLGWTTTLANLSTAQTNSVHRIIDAAYRRVILAVDPRTGRAYRWSWLDDASTITTTADDSTYDLPDDFKTVKGDIYYPADEGRPPLTKVGYHKILELLAKSDLDGYPEVYAIRWDRTFDGTSGQRAQITFYPTPDQEWIFVYQYEVLVPENIRSGTPYPRGGMVLSEVLRQATVAEADLQMNNSVGPQEERYREMLIQAIDADRDQYANHIGYNGNGNQDNGKSSTIYGTYNGVTPTW